MPSLLTAQEFVFDTEALKDAFFALPPSERHETNGYDEAALEALISYFADWDPARNTDRRASPAASLEDLSADEKRDLYSKLTERLVENFASQYGRTIEVQSAESLSIGDVEEFEAEENAKHETDIMQAYDELQMPTPLAIQFPPADERLQATRLQTLSGFV